MCKKCVETTKLNPSGDKKYIANSSSMGEVLRLLWLKMIENIFFLDSEEWWECSCS